MDFCFVLYCSCRADHLEHYSIVTMVREKNQLAHCTCSQAIPCHFYILYLSFGELEITVFSCLTEWA